MQSDVWCIPLSRVEALICAPFHGITTLVNRSMADAVARCLADPDEPIPDGAEWIRNLQQPGDRPQRKTGAPDPQFLGLVPTRGCMMQCAYCDFVSMRNHSAMTFDRIRQTIEGYADLLRERNAAEWNMHFFGGEPFAAFREIVYAVNYARKKADELGIPTHFEVTTNGYYSEEKCRWIAEYFDTVVLSLDGFPDAQNLHRPGPGGKDSFSVVCHSADIFSRGSCELIIRSCISAENVEMLADWAVFLSERWFPEAVCLEPMIESPQAEKNGLLPPDPDAFVRNWIKAARVMKSRKIRLVCSSGEIAAPKNSICPIGWDALIVTPDGVIGGCWQLAENQNAGGGDLHFGMVDAGGIAIDMDLLEKQRALSEANRESCSGCFCYAYCAGGCMLKDKQKNDFCRVTKMLTLWQLLDRLGCSRLGDQLLENESFRIRLAETEDFRIGAANYPNDSSPISDTAEPSPIISQEPRTAGIPPLPADPLSGWIRDGSRIMLVDPKNNSLSVLDGDDALRFQLEHSGMSHAEAETVWKALMEEG